MFTVCLLLYGDYPDLAARLLGSLSQACWRELDIRIGCNAVSPLTKSHVMRFVDADWVAKPKVIYSKANLLKYPMMRRLMDLGPLQDLFMWFDDDSWVQPSAKPDWFDTVHAALSPEIAAQAGSIWQSPTFRSEQKAWYKAQPWYTGVPYGRRINFITGGWWAAKSAFLQEHGYPMADLTHNGGDVLLGMIALQQKKRLVNFSQDVAINADDAGRCSKAKRRGVSQAPYGSLEWQKLRSTSGNNI